MDLARHDQPTAGPDPTARAEVAEDWERQLAGLSESERRLLRAVREGDCLAQAAERLGVSVRTLQRWVLHIRERLTDRE